MTVWDFADRNPWTAFFLACIFAWMVVTPIRLYFRSRNIAASGWPPVHLDADGDTQLPDTDST